MNMNAYAQVISFYRTEERRTTDTDMFNTYTFNYVYLCSIRAYKGKVLIYVHTNVKKIALELSLERER